MYGISELLVVFALSFFFISILLRYAKKLHLLDVPNDRSHHCNIIPRGAGIGFMGAFFFGVIFFHFDIFSNFWYVFASIGLVLGVGIVDDRYEVSAKLKFIVIFIAVTLLWFYGITIDNLGSWFGYPLHLYSVLALFFSMFALAGFTNALNLIDGLDGLAGSISIVIIACFLYIGISNHDLLMIIISSQTIAVLVGFLLLNWNPAKIFMGDSGSLSLGFIISILAVLSLHYIHPVVVLYFAALPILDTLIVMIRRIRRGKSPFSPDKTHIHHIMVKFFNNDVKKTVIFLVVLQIVFSSVGYLIENIIISNENNASPFFALLFFVLMFFLFYLIFTGIKKKQ